MVLNADVSPPGSHTVRIVASFGEDTLYHTLSVILRMMVRDL